MRKVGAVVSLYKWAKTLLQRACSQPHKDTPEALCSTHMFLSNNPKTCVFMSIPSSKHRDATGICV